MDDIVNDLVLSQKGKLNASNHTSNCKETGTHQGRIQKYGLGGREGMGSRLLPSPFPSPPLPFLILSPPLRSRPP